MSRASLWFRSFGGRLLPAGGKRSSGRRHHFGARTVGLLVVAISLSSSGCRFVSGSDRHRPDLEYSAPETPKSADSWQRGQLPADILKGTPRQGGEVRIQIGSEPPSLNTLVDSDWWAAQITGRHVYESLLEIDPYDYPRYRVRPCLAERWEVSPDQRTYTFWLRRDVRWHDGEPFTSRDVVATFDKIQDPTTKAMHVRAYTQELSSYRAIGKYEVQFRLKRPYFLMLDGVFADVPIQPAHLIQRMNGRQYNEAATNPLNRHPVGTGPFRFVRWDTNQRIVLERNNAYWRRPPHIERLVFRIVKDATVALELAERNDLDVVSRIRSEQWVTMDERRFRPHYHRSLFYDANYAWIGYNLDRPVFSDRRVRTAMTMLTNRPGIIRALLHGLAKPTTCHFYWASPACDPSIRPLPYDPIRAVDELEKAGWTDHDGDGIRDKGGTALRYVFMLPAGSEDAARMATLIKEDLGRAGIDMQLQRVEWSAFLSRLRDRDFDACTLSWASGSPREDPTQVWHSMSINGGSNFVGFRNARADAIMDEARGELDDDRRNRLYRELGRILHWEQPYTWLYVRPRLSLVHRRLFGVRETLPGWQYEDWWIDDKRAGAASSR